jgi:hypothetical protein
VGYWVSDFIGGIASRQVAAVRVVLVSYPIAMVLLAGMAAVVGGHVSPSAIAVWSRPGLQDLMFCAALAADPNMRACPKAVRLLRRWVKPGLSS